MWRILSENSACAAPVNPADSASAAAPNNSFFISLSLCVESGWSGPFSHCIATPV